MTVAQRAAAVKMREDGQTYQQIADHFGISRQAAWYSINENTRRNRERNYEKCVYPNLADWLKMRGLSQKQFAERSNMSASFLNQFLMGKQGISKYNIDAILAVTGLTYEVAFSRKDVT